MKEYILISLGEMLSHNLSEEKIHEAFKKFSCQREADLEDFLIHKAIAYEKADFGKTYLFVDEEKLNNNELVIMAYFTISQSTLDISELSQKQRRKAIGLYPGRDNRTSLPTYLIGQLGRCDLYTSEDLSGEQILDECYSTISAAAQIVGGNFIMLECREQMFSKFYEKKEFKKLYKDLDENGLYTLFKKVNFKDYRNRFAI